MDQVQMKLRSTALITAMVGKDLVDAWWASPNKAFGNITPNEQWLNDPDSVYMYLMQHAYGGW